MEPVPGAGARGASVHSGSRKDSILDRAQGMQPWRPKSGFSATPRRIDSSRPTTRLLTCIQTEFGNCSEFWPIRSIQNQTGDTIPMAQPFNASIPNSGSIQCQNRRLECRGKGSACEFCMVPPCFAVSFLPEPKHRGRQQSGTIAKLSSAAFCCVAASRPTSAAR